MFQIRKFALFSTLFLFFSFVNAQTHAAKKILDDLQLRYKQNKNVYFEYQYNKGESNFFKGKLHVMGNKYFLTSNENNQIFDGKKLYTILKNEKEITISSPKKESIINPINILNSYKEGYNYNIIKKENELTYIKLTPIDKNNTSYYELIINTKKKELTQIKEFKEKKQILKVEITKHQKNLALNSSIFVFDKNKYKDYYITNLD